MIYKFELDGMHFESDIRLSGGSEGRLSGPPENCYPAEAADLTIEHIWQVSGYADKTARVELTGGDFDEMEKWLLNNEDGAVEEQAKESAYQDYVASMEARDEAMRDR